MRRRAGAALLLLSVLAFFASAVAARDEAPIAVEVSSPPAGQALFGRHEIRAAVVSGVPVARVLFLVDGRPVGVRQAPPWAVDADFGQDNRAHRVEVVVYDSTGRRAHATLSAPALQVHEVIDLELQQLYVTVTNRRGRRILDLEADDFQVFDESERQEIVTFERGNVPFTAMILLDGSSSMTGAKLASALAGARAFVEGMQELDEARLLVVADRLLKVSPFVGPGAGLTRALDEVSATGGTALYDNLFLAMETLEDRQGRRVVILLSDGYDSHSVLSLDQVTEVARRSQALFYWLRLRDVLKGNTAPLTTWRSERQARSDVNFLAETVRDTGGRIVEVASPGEMPAAFREILAELREQYAIGYYPEPRLNGGSWRTVQVLVDRRGVRPRLRSGYFDR